MMSEKHEEVLQILTAQLKWKRRASILLQRIRDITKNQSLSVRQYKILRKLRTRERVQKMKLDLEEVADLFPGKTMATLKSAVEDLANKKIF